MSDSTTPSKFLSPQELSQLIRRSPGAIRTMIYRGQIPAEAIVRHTARGKRLYRRSVIERFFRLTEKGGSK